MCNLCDPETREAERKAMISLASDLRELADKIHSMAFPDGIKPHTREAELLSIEAHNAIRRLVDHWL